MSIVKLIAYDNIDFELSGVVSDQCTSDELVKQKARSINLIKHNPNLFLNRSSEGLYEILGGHRSAVLTLACGVLALLYRKKVNSFRHIAPREGVWFNTLYFLFGTSVGAFYSCAFFLKWQVLFNDYFANFLLKRFKGSSELHRRNIYKLKDVENTDECYYFSDSFVNNFHL